MPFPSRVPVALREIVERACSVDPEQRYPSAVEMRDALALAIGQGSAKTDARRWPAALLAALAVAVTGVAAVVGVPELRERLGPARETESEVTPTPSQAAAAPAPPTQVASPAPQRAESEAAPVKASIPANVDFGSYHALVVGNNAYEALPRLNTAVDDALAVAALLRDAYDFDVTMLTNATRGEIIGSLAAYRARLTRDDNLLIYYAGHGWYDDDAGRGYWLPVGATKADPSNWVSNTDVSDMLRAMEVGQAIVVADSCYSGSLTRAASMIFSRTYYQRMREERTRVVLTSGGLGPVADGSGGDHSVFAKALLDALRENQGVLEGQSLFAAIRRPVMLGAAQVPQYGDIRFAGHEGGDFLFVRRH